MTLTFLPNTWSYYLAPATQGSVTLGSTGNPLAEGVSTLTFTFTPGTIPTGWVLDAASLSFLADLIDDKSTGPSGLPGIQLFADSHWVVTLDLASDVTFAAGVISFVVRVTKGTGWSATTSPATVSFAPAFTTTSISYQVGTGTAPADGTSAGSTQPVVVPTANRSFVDVRFGNLAGLAIAGLNPTHLSISGPGVVGTMGITEVLAIGNGTYRYLLNGSFRPGQVFAVFDLTFLNGGTARAPPGWNDTQGFNVAGTSADAVRTDTDSTGAEKVSAVSGSVVGRDWINGRHYFEIRFRPTSGYAIDPTSINGDELRLVGPGGTVIALGAPVRVGTTDIWRYSFAGSLAVGQYTLTMQAGSFRDNSGTANQAEDERFSIAAPSSGLSSPLNGSQLSNADFNSRGWVDVTFADAKAESVLDSPAEFSLTTTTGDTIVLVGTPVRLGTTDVYRYFFVGLTSTTGTLTFVWTASSWTDNGDLVHGLVTAKDENDNLLATGSPATTSIATVSSRTWLDVVYTPAGQATVTDVDGNELAGIAGLTAETIDKVFAVGDQHLPLPVHRRPRPRRGHGQRPRRLVERHRRQHRSGQHLELHPAAAGAVLLHRDLRRPAAADPLRRRAAARPERAGDPGDQQRAQAVHPDLRRPAQADQARHRGLDLRPVRARHGRRHHQHPRLLGRRDPGDQLLRARGLRAVPLRQGHLPDQHHRCHQDRDDHPQGHRRRRHRRHPHLRPAGRQLLPRAGRPGPDPPARLDHRPAADAGRLLHRHQDRRVASS